MLPLAATLRNNETRNTHPQHCVAVLMLAKGVKFSSAIQKQNFRSVIQQQNFRVGNVDDFADRWLQLIHRSRSEQRACGEHRLVAVGGSCFVGKFVQCNLTADVPDCLSCLTETHQLDVFALWMNNWSIISKVFIHEAVFAVATSGFKFALPQYYRCLNITLWKTFCNVAQKRSLRICQSQTFLAVACNRLLDACCIKQYSITAAWFTPNISFQERSYFLKLLNDPDQGHAS